MQIHTLYFLRKIGVLRRSDPPLPITPQDSPEHPRAAQNSPERPRAAQSRPGQPRATKSSQRQSRTAQSSPEHPRAAQGNPEEPKADPPGRPKTPTRQSQIHEIEHCRCLKTCNSQTVYFLRKFEVPRQRSNPTMPEEGPTASTAASIACFA